MTTASSQAERKAEPVSTDAYREQLGRILQSPDFEATERGRKFLTYIVEETLAERSEWIKAYSIATDVFGRNASFDPQTDPIVRVEAGHLRRALERYYLTAGSDDPIVITIPKGRYVTVFDHRIPKALPPSTEVAPPAYREADTGPSGRWHTRWHWPALALAVLVGAALLAKSLIPFDEGAGPSTPDVPRLLVVPFEDLSAAANSGPLTRGLTQEIISQIAKFKDITVVEASPGDSSAERASATSRPVRYVLSGAIEIGKERLRLQVRVGNRDDGTILWANSYEGDLKVADLLQIEADIARRVATAVAQPYGVIFQADSSRRVENPPADWQAYSCTLTYYDYRTSLDGKMHPTVRKCLEQAVARFPNYATAWALLSQTYIDEFRFHYPIDPQSTPASLDRALAAARRAVELDPQNVRGLQAEMFALYFQKEIDAALKVGEQALAINPNDTELMGEYGFRLAMAGKWDRGCPLIAEVRERNPGPLAYYEAALALCAYFGGDYEKAIMWIRKTTGPHNTYYHLIAAAIYGEAGLKSDAEKERAWLNANEPDVLKNLRAILASRFGRREDTEKVLGSLGKAGLLQP